MMVTEPHIDIVKPGFFTTESRRNGVGLISVLTALSLCDSVVQKIGSGQGGLRSLPYSRRDPTDLPPFATDNY